MFDKKIIIETQNLVKEYFNGKSCILALDNVTFSVQAGDFVTITGPSGSGKTTLLNLLGILDTPTSGKIQIDGIDLENFKGDRIADFRRKNIGFIFQLHQLIPTLTVLENIKLPLLPYQKITHYDIEAKALEIIHEVGMRDSKGKMPFELSGGEQQKVAIARALINSPKIVLADEPTGNLDLNTGEEIVALLKKINKKLDTTILLVTHNTKFAQIGNRHLSLIKGALSEINKTRLS